MSDLNNSHSTLSADHEKETAVSSREETMPAREETANSSFSNAASGVSETAVSSVYSSTVNGSSESLSSEGASSMSAPSLVAASGTASLDAEFSGAANEGVAVPFQSSGYLRTETISFDEHTAAAVDAWQYHIANRLDIIAFSMIVCTGLLFFLFLKSINITKK